MAKKSSFLSCYSKIKYKSYGNDYIIGSILQNDNISICHIDNFTVVSINDDNDIHYPPSYHANNQNEYSLQTSLLEIPKYLSLNKNDSTSS